LVVPTLLSNTSIRFSGRLHPGSATSRVLRDARRWEAQLNTVTFTVDRAVEVTS